MPKYSGAVLKTIGLLTGCQSNLQLDIWNRIKHLGIQRQKRGTRGGVNLARSIKQRITNRSDKWTTKTNNVNSNNLIEISTLNELPETETLSIIKTVISHRSNIATDGNNLNNKNLIYVKPEKSAMTINMMDIGYFNARSVRNKSDEICDFVVENDLDVCAISETWLSGNDSDKIVCGDITPTGYSLKHMPRKGRRGGGVALL